MGCKHDSDRKSRRKLRHIRLGIQRRAAIRTAKSNRPSSTVARHGTDKHSQGVLPTLYPTRVHNVSRSRSVIVPNAGGFAAVSPRFPNAKISLGYRIDAFFSAIDGGVDTRRTYDRDFYGPFATISISLGDRQTSLLVPGPRLVTGLVRAIAWSARKCVSYSVCRCLKTITATKPSAVLATLSSTKPARL